MVATDGPRIVRLGVEDAAAGLVLSTEAHWNQTIEDWRFFLSEGFVFGIRDGARLAATAALLPYSGNNAWISMVLVTESHRRRGLATQLVDAGDAGRALLARSPGHGIGSNRPALRLRATVWFAHRGG